MGQIFNGLFGTNAAANTNNNTAQAYAQNNQQIDATRAQQGSLVNQLQAQANGQGPQLSQAILNQAAAQSGANANAIAAGARGVNPALANYQAQNANAAAMQNAAQQGVGAGIQQQLGALGQLGGQLNTMYNQGTQGQQFNTANDVSVGLAQTQQNASSSGGLLGGLGSLLGFASGGAVPSGNGPRSALANHFKMLADGGDVDTAGDPGIPGVPKVVTPPPAQKSGGGGGGITSLLPLLAAAAKGGEVRKMYADGTDAVPSLPDANYDASGHSALYGTPPPPTAPTASTTSPAKPHPFSASAQGMSRSSSSNPIMSGFSALGAGLRHQGLSILSSLGSDGSSPATPDIASSAASGFSKGGKVPALVSPGEGYLPPSKVAKVAKSKDKGKAALKEAERIPGKAKVEGDSYANDTVPKTLEAGGIVLPRHVTQAKDPAKEAAKFVSKVMAQKKMGMRR